MALLCTAFYPSPLGLLTLASEGEGLVGLWFKGQRHYGARYALDSAVLLQHEAAAAPPPLQDAAAWLAAYFAGQHPSPAELPLAPAGTLFQQAVWRLLLQIPYGQTTTYGALAETLRKNGIPASAQAVGGAVGHNPISIIIPCHRVVAAAPAAAWSYAAGAQTKKALLQHEQALLTLH